MQSKIPSFSYINIISTSNFNLEIKNMSRILLAFKPKKLSIYESFMAFGVLKKTCINQ